MKFTIQVLIEPPDAPPLTVPIQVLRIISACVEHLGSGPCPDSGKIRTFGNFNVVSTRSYADAWSD
jgi:hypothetical protein